MTKSQLQPEMLVETRDGDIYLVLSGKLFGINTIGFSLSVYDEDLTVHFAPNCDIVKVYTTCADSISDLQDKRLHTLIWERVTYPMWFKQVDTSLVVKFTSLNEGVCVVASNGYSHGYPLGKHSMHWTPHTNTVVWEQVEEPAAEMTLEEISQALGYKVTLKA